MKSNSKEVSINLNLPEFDKKDIKLRLSKNSLSINAHKKSETKVKEKDFFHEEKVERQFFYSTTLPSIIPKKAKIEFKKGNLEIKAPKQ